MNETIAAQALRKWAEWNPEVDFDAACDYCLEHDGLVYIGPDGVLLLADGGDRWVVQLAVGSLPRLFRLVPQPKPLIEWARASRSRRGPVVLSWERFLQLLASHGKIPRRSGLRVEEEKVSGSGLDGPAAGRSDERGLPGD